MQILRSQTGAGSLSYMVVLVVVGPGSGEGKSRRVVEALPLFLGWQGGASRGMGLEGETGKGVWIVDRSSRTPSCLVMKDR
jgi:hypothetical protein